MGVPSAKRGGVSGLLARSFVLARVLVLRPCARGESGGSWLQTLQLLRPGSGRRGVTEYLHPLLCVCVCV